LRSTGEGLSKIAANPHFLRPELLRVPVNFCQFLFFVIGTLHGSIKFLPILRNFQITMAVFGKAKPSLTDSKIAAFHPALQWVRDQGGSILLHSAPLTHCNANRNQGLAHFSPEISPKPKA
jgi:hypothetical protein